MQTLPDAAAGQPVTCPNCQAEMPAEPVPALKPPKRRVRAWAIGLGLVLALGGAGLAAYLFINRPVPTDFTDPNGIFSARFPGPPEARTVSEARPQVLRWGERLYRAQAWGMEYSVAILDGLNVGDQLYGPATRDKHINNVIVIALTNASGRPLFERQAIHEGHHAQEIVFLRQDDGRLTALRVLAGERCVLRLAVTGPGDKDAPADFLDRAGEFFNGAHVEHGFGPPIVVEPPLVSAAALADAYRADARAADAKYKDRWLRVTGSVRTVARNGTELLLEAGAGVLIVKRAPQARRSVPVRRAGTEVTISGKCRGLEAAAGAEPRVLVEDAIVARPPPQ
jgi:hypothetical protein